MSGMFTQAKKASHNTRQDAVRFAEADIDCDGKLDYAEFLSMHPAIIREGHTEDEIRAWFEAADSRSGVGFHWRGVLRLPQRRRRQSVRPQSPSTERRPSSIRRSEC